MTRVSVCRVIQGVFPCFIRAPSDSNAQPIEQLYAGPVRRRPTVSLSGATSDHVTRLLQPGERYKDILLALERSTNQNREIQEWWIVDQPAASLVPVGGGAPWSNRREAGLQLFVFSDKVSPPSLGFLAGYGYG